MEKETGKPTVLILCTGNSCRSHMAEGILKSVAGDLIDVQSAGSDPAGYVHPLSIKALDEIGIDISANTSKHMNQFLEQDVETVITVCGNADQACPTYPGSFVATTGRFPTRPKQKVPKMKSGHSFSPCATTFSGFFQLTVRAVWIQPKPSR